MVLLGKPTGSRSYTPEEKADALMLYHQQGPSEAARQTGIPSGTLKSWAHKAGVTTDVVVLAPNTRHIIEAHHQRAALKRAKLIELLMDKMLDAMKRMDEPMVEFMGKDATQVLYPKANAFAFRMYTMSIESLLRAYRLETGQSTSNTAIDFRQRIETEAAKHGLDPDEVMREAEKILAEEQAQKG